MQLAHNIHPGCPPAPGPGRHHYKHPACPETEGAREA